ncbi:peptidyl-alpha-hydroxyglycine alpha-amidating lyase 2 [Ixodes scapularis]|uniref:peptidyl-alpha-hydroxyglycine alpha-amidating lyase 2 n=1 Tax=Ixodes scapularis TaxID=6945 RepID=UPI001A9CCE9F|nr:peptidyl-alpha-hydroxyglycine alpha-amidating lyase 2 [Ixodes scapularis]
MNANWAMLLWQLAAVAAVVASAFRDSRPGEENRLLGRLQSDSPRADILLRHLIRAKLSPVAQEDEGWPPREVTGALGPTSAVAVDSRGLVHILHRGPVVWNASSFDQNHVYRYQQSPISEPAIVVLDPKTGLVVGRWGQNMFFMPHGLYIDGEDHVWVTDVALHQVFRFPPNGTSAELVLGEAFVPGSGSGHFCQPTDVALPPSGLVFISDGYCNSRIAIFTPEGKHVTDVATRDGLWIPHSLTYVQRDNTVCVADRENQRVLCFWAGLGPDFGFLRSSVTGQLGRVYAVASVGSYLYGLQIDDGTSAASGFRVELYPGSRVQTFSPRQRFIQPHDLAVSEDGRTLYAVDVDAANRKKVYKFRI